MLKIGVCLLFFATLSVHGEGQLCAEPYAEIGCYRDLVKGQRALPKLLFSWRRRSGPGAQWRNWRRYTYSVVCACAEAAAENGFRFFAVQYYGECWAGHTASFLSFGRSEHCLDSNREICPSVHPLEECVGKARTNFVYGTLGPAPQPEAVKPTLGHVKVTCPPDMFVAFAMDTSGSVSDEHFKPYKEFIKGIIGGLDRGIGVALLHYDDEVYTDITFDDNQDRGHLIKVIESIEHTRGSTETQDALRASRELLNSPVVLRGHAVRVVCVFTDGKTFPNKEALIKPIAKLRADGIKVRAVGIGDQVDPEELEYIGGKRSNYLLVPSFEDLRKYSKDVKELICNEQ